jgi:hypothetical protein
MTKKEHERCPVCGCPIFNIEIGWQKHIIAKAKHEVWLNAFDAKAATPHFDYYRDNSKPTKLHHRTFK